MPRSRTLTRRILLGLCVVVAGLAGLWAVRAAAERRALRDDLDQLRAALAAHRIASNACQTAVAREEATFRAYHERVDSLRDEIRDYEALDDRGVPGEHYVDYLDAFDLFNESVPAWQERADSLQARWEACRDVVRQHNLLADSLRRRVDALAGGNR